MSVMELFDKRKLSNAIFNLEVLKELQKEWVEWCRKGLLTGRPIGEITMQGYNYYLDYYFERLPRRYQRTPLISIDCLRHVFCSIKPEYFSTKENIYKALRSFVKYLIAKNLLSESIYAELRKLKPKRIYPPKKLHCTVDEFELLLEQAGKRYNCQSEYDVILSKTAFATVGFTGLRASELCNLRLNDVDLEKRKIFVYLGKGYKNRCVGICSRLHSCLEEYLKVRPESDPDYFFLTISSSTKEPVPFNRATLLRKLKRLSKRLNIQINTHGLRRTFATVAANAGKPINIISMALGHSNLKTTQGYLMTTQDEVVKEMQGW